MNARRRALGGLGLLALGAALPAQAGAAAGPAPDPAALAALLARLDAAFAQRDAAAWLGAFAPDQPAAHHALERRLQCAFGGPVRLQRRSQPVGAPQPLGPRWVVRVRAELAAADPGPALPLRGGDELLVLRTDGPTPVPTLCLEVPAGWPDPAPAGWRCPPCNYTVDGAPGWLCVPQGQERSQALEAATFHLLGSSLAVDVSVQVAPAAAAARPVAAAAADLAAALRDLDPTLRPGAAAAWLPPAHAAAPPAALQACRFPVGGGAADAEVMVFHVVAFGALQHVLLVRGRQGDLDAHRAAVDALLASYRLLQTDRDLAAAAAEPLRHHLGGELDGAAYRNRRFGIALDGPDGWRAEQRAGGAAFRVTWTGPAGGRLWLTGHAVPAGLLRWCPATADRWLQQLAARSHLRLPDAADAERDSGWEELPGCSAHSRTLVAPEQPPDRPGLGRDRLLRLLVDAELLVVVDGFASDAPELAALRAALQSLRRF